MLYLYREAGALDQAWERSAVMRERGFTIERLDAPSSRSTSLRSIPPGWRARSMRPVDEFADAAAFCRELAARCRTLGVSFYLENEILSHRAARRRHPRSGDAQGPDARRRLRLRARRDGPAACASSSAPTCRSIR